MKSAIRTFPLVILALFCMGMAQKPPAISVRFFAEANKRDSSTFSSPIALNNSEHTMYIEKIPAITERSFRSIYPFHSTDGTWGCSFKLDEKGTMDLEVVTTSQRGRLMLAFILTKEANHQVCEMLIDQRISDGIITIPSGITDSEMQQLMKVYPVMGQARPTKKK